MHLRGEAPRWSNMPTNNSEQLCQTLGSPTTYAPNKRVSEYPQILKDLGPKLGVDVETFSAIFGRIWAMGISLRRMTVRVEGLIL